MSPSSMQPTPPFEGGCMCGRVRYTCNKVPVWSVNCHCRACQKLSGAPFVSAFSVAADSASVTGDVTTFKRVSETGNMVQTHVCTECGTRIFAQSGGARHLMNFFAATLDDQSRFLPISNVYLSEKVEWVDPPEARFNFAKMPEF